MVNEIVVDISDLVPIKKLNNSYSDKFRNTSTTDCFVSTKVTIIECDDFDLNDLPTPRTECCPNQIIGSIPLSTREQQHKQHRYEQFLQLHRMQLHDEQQNDDQSVTVLSEVSDVPILSYCSGPPKRELKEDIDTVIINLDSSTNIIYSDDEWDTPCLPILLPKD